MSEIKLKPCPFCGGRIEYHPWSHIMDNFFNKDTIICPTCDFIMEGVNQLSLFKRWNTRKPMENTIERINMEILEELSDCGDDWFAAEQINKAIDIIKEENEFGL